MAADPSGIPGWYGKLPSLGDFASRRLTQPFVATWDTWLQHAMTASRTALGSAWLEVYMNSPIWRFLLLPGVIGDTLWGGIIMPSIDKVGRHFPLTIAVAIADRPGCIAAVMGARDWYGDLEETALATLNIDFSVQQFEEHLASMPFPEGTTLAAVTARVAGLATWWQSPSGLFEMPTPTGCDMQQLVQAAATQLFQVAGAGKTLWWREADTSGPIQLACFSGLPHPEHYSALLKSAAPGVNPVTASGLHGADATHPRLT